MRNMGRVACRVAAKVSSIPFARNPADGDGTMTDQERAQTATVAVCVKIRRIFRSVEQEVCRVRHNAEAKQKSQQKRYLFQNYAERGIIGKLPNSAYFGVWTHYAESRFEVFAG